MAEDQIRYDILAQEALRGVVKKVLTEVGKTGLPGDHHFFISFDTHAAGVRISQRLLDQYEDEMTIVLQNQYWDLKVSETGFEVGLSFDGISEILVIPFSSIKGFFDPSVQFGLQFEVAGEEESTEASISKLKPESASPSSSNDEKTGDDKSPPASDETKSDSDSEESGEKVVSLDAFRKKP